MAPKDDYEAAIKACYSTWSETYHQDYYTAAAVYPPVHLDIIRSLLRDARVKRVLDAGCGPASILREIAGNGLDLYGFDLTPEMVAEARRVFEQLGLSPQRLWEGSVLSPESFWPPGAPQAGTFDAALCIGVLPHIPETADLKVICNLREAVRPGGLVVIEARNQLFALFTLNRYSYKFFVEDLCNLNELIQQTGTLAPALEQAVDNLKKQFCMDLPPVRKGKQGEPGYDQVRSRTHNPLVLKDQFAAAGFADTQVHFYHYHALPPMFEADMPKLFRRLSLARENPADWRGHFMASAFLVSGRRA